MNAKAKPAHRPSPDKNKPANSLLPENSRLFLDIPTFRQIMGLRDLAYVSFKRKHKSLFREAGTRREADVAGLEAIVNSQKLEQLRIAARDYMARTYMQAPDGAKTSSPPERVVVNKRTLLKILGISDKSRSYDKLRQDYPKAFSRPGNRTTLEVNINLLAGPLKERGLADDATIDRLEEEAEAYRTRSVNLTPFRGPYKGARDKASSYAMKRQESAMAANGIGLLKLSYVSSFAKRPDSFHFRIITSPRAASLKGVKGVRYFQSIDAAIECVRAEYSEFAPERRSELLNILAKQRAAQPKSPAQYTS